MPVNPDAIKNKIENLPDADEEKKPKSGQNIIEASYDAAQRRLNKNVMGSIGIVIAFVFVNIASMAMSWLDRREVITEEGLIFIMIGLATLAAFAFFSRLTNFIDLVLQRKAIDLDSKELVNLGSRVKIDITRLEKERELAQKRTVFERDQDRLDLKLKQDLEIRAPFYEQATRSLFDFFSRDNIVEALQVPSSFTKAIEEMDNSLLKRSNIDITVKDMQKAILELANYYKEVFKNVGQNNTLLDQIAQQHAEHQIKIQEMSIGMKSLQSEIGSLSRSVDSLIEMFSGVMKTTTDEKSIVHQSDPPGKSEAGETSNSDSIASQIDKIVEKDNEKLPPPP